MSLTFLMYPCQFLLQKNFYNSMVSVNNFQFPRPVFPYSQRFTQKINLYSDVNALGVLRLGML